MALPNYFLPYIHVSYNVTLQLISEILRWSHILLWPIECSSTNSMGAPNLNLKWDCMVLLPLSWHHTTAMLEASSCYTASPGLSATE